MLTTRSEWTDTAHYTISAKKLRATEEYSWIPVESFKMMSWV